MKKTALLVLFVTLSMCSFAQGLDVGIKGGLNVASQNISTSFFKPDISAKAGFHGGVFVTYMFSEKLGIQPEFLYSMQGSTTDFDGEEYEDKLGYLNIPLLVRFNILDMLSVHAGPQFGFLLSAKETFEGITEDIKSDFKSSDFGIAVGAEADLIMNLGVGARYVFGMTDIVSGEDSSWSGYEIKNAVFQLYVKFKFLNGSKK
jgi:hypothetical protein